MPAAAEVQIGTGYINGIPGAMVLTPFSAGSVNFGSAEKSDNFKTDEIVSMNGAVVETVIASQAYREFTLEFAPSGTTRGAAQTVVNNILASWTPLVPLTISGATITSTNGAYNYIGGLSVKFTRDGVAVGNVKLRQYQLAADGSYGALALVVA